MWRLVLFLIIGAVSNVWATENLYDSYEHATECPANGSAYESANTGDSNAFIRCQCTSYVASKLSALFTVRYYNNGAPTNLMRSFHNTRYYMPQVNRDRWSHGSYWRDAAIFAGIGVTGARDNFTWDERSYNAVFVGDVAWWGAWDYVNSQGERRRNQYGHVAYVESAEPDAAGLGVKCVTISEYNWVPHDFNRRRVCKTDGHNFPDAFLHIDRDHSYCTTNPNRDNCAALWGDQMTASSGIKADGLGGSSDPFNLKVNRFWVRDVASGTDLDPATSTVRVGQIIQPRIQVKAKDGDTHDHMRPGKNRIEVDLHARLDIGDWFFLKREYIQATNLPSGATHTEHMDYPVPPGVSTISFKAKIDAEDEASESNEGDNWSAVQTFSVVSIVPVTPLNLTITVTN
jgi:surface antigen